LVTIFIGLGSIFGGYFSGVASDTLKLRITGDLVLLFYAFSILITYLATLINLYWFVCLVGFIWGFEVNFL
jgi:predicted MFS family arabinose efflux permease